MGGKKGEVRERLKKIKQQAGEGVERRKGLTSHSWGVGGWVEMQKVGESSQ
jgi:hypothetical protein